MEIICRSSTIPLPRTPKLNRDSVKNAVEVTKENPFITNNATNLTYCLEWAQEEAKRKKKALNMRNDPTKGTVYGVVDLMNIFGEYKTRNSAKEYWRLTKNTPPNLLVVSDSRQFFVSLDYFGKPMDFCTLTDFFDHVIPHMRGNVARTINTARGHVATLVGTGSTVAVEVTTINREAAENASEPIREAIEDMRSTTEQAVISNAMVPVTIQPTLDIQNGKLSIGGKRKRHERILPATPLVSAGFRNPEDLCKPHIYFIQPGRDLILCNEVRPAKLLRIDTGKSVDASSGERGGGYHLIKFGITAMSDNSRLKTHVQSFGQDTEKLDWIACLQPAFVERELLKFCEAFNRREKCQCSRKGSNDTECFCPEDQKELDSLVNYAYKIAREHDKLLIGEKAIELDIEKEKTAQENAKALQKREETLQKREDTAQLQLQLELKKLEFQMQLKNLGIPTMQTDIGVHVATPGLKSDNCFEEITNWFKENSTEDTEGRLHTKTAFDLFVHSMNSVGRPYTKGIRGFAADVKRVAEPLGLVWVKQINIDSANLSGFRGRKLN